MNWAGEWEVINDLIAIESYFGLCASGGAFFMGVAKGFIALCLLCVNIAGHFVG
jgi:hypothetical protein